jgi:Tol biopolymer transport system component
MSVDWSPDGTMVLFTRQDPKTQSDLWAVRLMGDRTPVPVVKSNFDDGQGQFSPDGRWVAYVSNESGRNEIYVQGWPDSAGK